MSKYRAYFFGNHYISQIQHGIQAAHATAELFLKYNGDSPETRALYDWAINDKTMILLNGGFQSNLINVYAVLITLCEKLKLPYAKFHEEVDALNGALTNVCVIVPEEIYGIPPTALVPIDNETIYSVKDTAVTKKQAAQFLFWLLRNHRLA